MAYNHFAFYYDKLTQNVDYPARAEYILKLLNEHGHVPGLTLDLACGTGTLLFELLKQGVDIYGVDASMEMLTQAKDKAYDLSVDVLFLCQKMQELDLYGSVDTVLCTLDSINHLKSEEEVQKTFDRVFLFLNNDGYFLFDVNTVYKHEKILGNNAFVYEQEDLLCVWQNYYTPSSGKVQIKLDFFEKMGNGYQRYSENFEEQVYPLKKIEKMLHKSGFSDIYMFDEMKFTEPKDDSQRVFFVAVKGK
jgi:2-polyprenyl-3-methyl-5-hydroxy-6-metoxy-1,4-benzoquinol methylase